MCHFRHLCFLIFNSKMSINVSKQLSRTGFEPGTSRVRSNRPAKCATSLLLSLTNLVSQIYFCLILQRRSKEDLCILRMHIYEPNLTILRKQICRSTKTFRGEESISYFVVWDVNVWPYSLEQHIQPLNSIMFLGVPIGIHKAYYFQPHLCPYRCIGIAFGGDKSNLSRA